MTNEEYVRLHRHDDVSALSLQGHPEGVDTLWCLRQIEGTQIAERKLPEWAETAGLWFPPRLSMEQCSGELAATYKRRIVERLLPEEERTSLTDLTGGFGVDFCHVTPLFRRATYVERQPELCALARHNFPLLGLSDAHIVCAEAEAVVGECEGTLLLDPSRRNAAGRRTVALTDCTPDATHIQHLWHRASLVLLKLSPMLDTAQTLRSLNDVTEVHAVGVDGECKELLLVVRPARSAGDVVYHCVNLPASESLACTEEERRQPADILSGAPREGDLLFEPSASVLKVACHDALARRHDMRKLHPLSHLYILPHPNGQTAALGRTFRIETCAGFGKESLRRMADGLGQANIAVRNFPSTVAQLRHRLRLREGGDIHLFATTLSDGRHAILRCHRA